MGDAQKLTPDDQIRSAREGFDSGRDFTVAVEEEFAILDPQTLGLVNRFEELAAGAVGSPLEPDLVGELIASADRAIAVTDGLRTFLPHLLAYSGSSPFVEGVYTYLHSARTQIFTRMFPRCGIPDSFGDWDTYERYVRFLYDTGSLTEHTQLWWSVRPHHAFGTP